MTWNKICQYIWYLQVVDIWCVMCVHDLILIEMPCCVTFADLMPSSMKSRNPISITSQKAPASCIVKYFSAIHEPSSLGSWDILTSNTCMIVTWISPTQTTPVKETNQLPHHASLRGNFRRCSWTRWTRWTPEAHSNFNHLDSSLQSGSYTSGPVRCLS